MKGLQIESKRLQSGNFQVKFNLKFEDGIHKKGYVLAKPGITLKEVVSEIQKNLTMSFINYPDKELNENVNIFLVN